MVGYKKIIENMVDSSVHEYVENRIGGYVGFPDSVKLELDKELDHVSFEAVIKVKHLDFTVTGYVDDYGNVNVCCVRFDRFRCTEKDENGWWIDSSAKHFHEWIHGDDLKNFKFDR